MNFEFNIVELSSKNLIGMKVNSTMATAFKDCPDLWNRFGTRIGELKVIVPGGGYGISVMKGAEGDFTYWAAVEVPDDITPPAGMERFSLTGGAYVRTSAPNLTQLGDAFTAMYEQWPASQNEYDIDMIAPCFELYRPGWTPENPLDVFAPLKKK